MSGYVTRFLTPFFSKVPDGRFPTSFHQGFFVPHIKHLPQKNSQEKNSFIRNVLACPFHTSHKSLRRSEFLNRSLSSIFVPSIANTENGHQSCTKSWFSSIAGTNSFLSTQHQYAPLQSLSLQQRARCHSSNEGGQTLFFPKSTSWDVFFGQWYNGLEWGWP